MEGRQGKGWYHRGYLPHCDDPGRIQHITFHLYDSLPRFALERMEAQLQSWKRYTAREIRKYVLHRDSHGSPSCTRQNINKGKPTKTPFWQRDFWDRYIRDDAHFHRVVRYIENNPVKAGLVRRAEDWPWGSARY